MDGGAGVDPAQDNRRLPAGITFLGQFIDHDITFDPTSSLEQQNDPDSVENFRTPAFELDSLYGSGPGVQPFFYDGAGRFLIGTTGSDVPRNRNDVALIGDPRNDENLIVNQLHLAFMKFHNAVLDGPAQGNFEEAQRIVRWHYQWIILHEYLRGVCGDDVVDHVLENGRRFYVFDGEAYMPVEFSIAAFRFGHSQVRPGYVIQPGATGQPPRFAAALFAADGNDLRGNRPIGPERAVDFRAFFGSQAQRGKRIDRRLASPLLDLPPTVVGPNAPAERRSLAIRNVQRSLAFNLPSGQSVARFMQEEELTEAELWADIPDASGPAPLWFYILREAETRADGEHLAGVGARVVAEVLIGILEGDTATYLNQWPNWTPELPSAEPGTFTMLDLLRFGINS